MLWEAEEGGSLSGALREREMWLFSCCIDGAPKQRCLLGLSCASRLTHWVAVSYIETRGIRILHIALLKQTAECWTQDNSALYYLTTLVYVCFYLATLKLTNVCFKALQWRYTVNALKSRQMYLYSMIHNAQFQIFTENYDINVYNILISSCLTAD